MDRVKCVRIILRGPFVDTLDNIVRHYTNNHTDELLLLGVDWDGQMLHQIPILTVSQLADLEKGLLLNPSPKDLNINVPPEDKESILHVTYLFFRHG